MYRILTLYLAKNSINKECYDTIIRQKRVKQTIVVVSAKKLDVPNNFVVEIPLKYPLPVRVGWSINRALEVYWDWRKYNYFFKIDNDVSIPPDYLIDLIKRKTPIIGPGCAMLIEASFFEKCFKSKWAVSYCDDLYMKAKAFAMGFIEKLWETNLKPITFEYKPSYYRAYIYGKEYYKFGDPFWFMWLSLAASIKNSLLHVPQRIPITNSIYSIGGYISEIGAKKYPWHKSYARNLTKLYLQKLLSKFL